MTEICIAPLDAAIAAGYTQELSCWAGDGELHIRVKPDTDLDTHFKAYHVDDGEYIRVKGWLLTFNDD